MTNLASPKLAWRRARALLTPLACGLFLLAASHFTRQAAIAQVVILQDGGEVQVQVPEQVKAARGGGGKPGQPPMPPQPGQPGAPPATPGQPDPNAKPGETKPEEGKPIKRPDKPLKPANPDELKAVPDEDGLVRFSFIGQPWVDVVEWVSQISGMPVDWTELPSDFLNLATPSGSRGYAPEEVRDLINKHLLARGYTMLEDRGLLSVHKTKDINSALVPRVRPDELLTRRPHEFVKVSFPLDWLVAEGAAEELAPYSSPNGKLTALKSTNRLEALDAVTNLRQIYEVIRQEQSRDSQERLVEEIVIKHIKAQVVREKLEEFLGIENKKNARPMNPQEMQMQQQMMQMQMQQQAQQQAQGAAAKKPAGKTETRFIVNENRNSVIAHAPPDRMATIRETIKLLDVAPAQQHSLQEYLGRMQTYRLASLDPKEVVRILDETGGLDPSTRLTADEKNRAIVANASPHDHLKVQKLIEKLDGSARQFKVVRLRRLAADQVAGTIDTLMGQPKEKKKQRRPYYDFYDFGYGGYGGNQESQSDDKFRVDADVENNRILLWCNETELQLVMELLEQLGEIAGRGSDPSTVRVVDSLSVEDEAEFLRRLGQAWKTLAPNDLQLPAPAAPKDQSPAADIEQPSDNKDGPASTKTTTKDQPKTKDGNKDKNKDKDKDKDKDKRARLAPRRSATYLVARSEPLDEATNVRHSADEATDDAAPAPSESSPSAAKAADTPAPIQEEPASSPDAQTEPNADAAPATGSEADPRSRADGRRTTTTARARGAAPDPRELPPVTISRGADGKYVISSQDPRALDLLEELMVQMAPHRKDYHIFKLKYAYAGWVKLNLTDFFEDKESAGKERMNMFWFGEQSDPDKDKGKLSKRRKLKFISDIDTNTILAQNATDEQLKTIQDLIDMYDVPEPVNTQAARVTHVYTIRYSKPSVIADVIKDAFRDLLSDNDKALQQQQQPGGDKNSQQRYAGGGGSTYIQQYSFGESGGQREPERTKVSFKGKLSLGVDDATRTLVVSTEGQILAEVIGQMVKTLDRAANGASNVQIVGPGSGANMKHVQQVLEKILGEQQGKPAQPANGQPMPGAQPGQGGPRGQMPVQAVNEG